MKNWYSSTNKKVSAYITAHSDPSSALHLHTNLVVVSRLERRHFVSKCGHRERLRKYEKLCETTIIRYSGNASTCKFYVQLWRSGVYRRQIFFSPVEYSLRFYLIQSKRDTFVFELYFICRRCSFKISLFPHCFYCVNVLYAGGVLYFINAR